MRGYLSTFLHTFKSKGGATAEQESRQKWRVLLALVVYTYGEMCGAYRQAFGEFSFASSCLSELWACN